MNPIEVTYHVALLQQHPCLGSLTSSFPNTPASPTVTPLVLRPSPDSSCSMR